MIDFENFISYDMIFLYVDFLNIKQVRGFVIHELKRMSLLRPFLGNTWIYDFE